MNKKIDILISFIVIIFFAVSSFFAFFLHLKEIETYVSQIRRDPTFICSEEKIIANSEATIQYKKNIMMYAYFIKKQKKLLSDRNMFKNNISKHDDVKDILSTIDRAIKEYELCKKRFECSKITYLSQFGTKGTENGQFYAPTSMVTDSSDNLYVFDSLNNRIQIFNPQGKYIRKIDNFKLENAQYIEFLDIDIDPSGNIYAIEPYRVQKFDSSGKILLKFGTNGINDGQFNIAQGIAVAKNGDIYVVDTGNNRVQKFDRSGKYISQFGTKGTSKGQFNLPRHIAIDSIGNIYVVDSRIQKFDSSGKYISEFALNASGKVAVDKSDNIYIGSSNGVDKYTNSGILLNKFDTKGAGNNSQSYGVWGLAIDNLNNIYISSGLENRVQKFKQVCEL